MAVAASTRRKRDRIARQIIELDRQVLLQKGQLTCEVKETIDRAGGPKEGLSFDSWVKQIGGPRGMKNPRRTMLNYKLLRLLPLTGAASGCQGGGWRPSGEEAGELATGTIEGGD